MPSLRILQLEHNLLEVSSTAIGQCLSAFPDMRGGSRHLADDRLINAAPLGVADARSIAASGSRTRRARMPNLCTGMHADMQALPEGLFSGGGAPLVRLDVSHNGLRELPRQLGELRGLQRLVANGNALGSVPHELGSLRALKELDLRSVGASTTWVYSSLCAEDHRAQVAAPEAHG